MTLLAIFDRSDSPQRMEWHRVCCHNYCKPKPTETASGLRLPASVWSPFPSCLSFVCLPLQGCSRHCFAKISTVQCIHWMTFKSKWNYLQSNLKQSCRQVLVMSCKKMLHFTGLFIRSGQRFLLTFQYKLRFTMSTLTQNWMSTKALLWGVYRDRLKYWYVVWWNLFLPLLS